MDSSALGGIDSWKTFNKMVSVAKARNSALNLPETKSIPKVSATAAFSTKVYTSDKSINSENIVKGSRFDAYA